MDKRSTKAKFIYTVGIVLGGLLLMFTLLCPFIKGSRVSFHEFDLSEFISMSDFVVDNSLPLEKLLTIEYSLGELEMYFGKYSSIGAGIIKTIEGAKSLSWNDVNSIFPVQCLRYYKNTHYSAYRVKEGGLFYVFWMVPLKSTPSELLDQTCPIRVRFSIYLNGLASIKDFEPIKKISTAFDMIQRDSQMQISFAASSGVYSYNLLDDGRVLEIKYNYEKLEELNDLIVVEYKVLKKEDCIAPIACIDNSDLPSRIDSQY